MLALILALTMGSSGTAGRSFLPGLRQAGASSFRAMMATAFVENEIKKSTVESACYETP